LVFDIYSGDVGYFFEKGTVGLCECGWLMAIDVNLSNYNSVGIDGHDDFRFGVGGTRQIAGISTDVVDDQGISRGDRRPTDSLIHGDMNMRRRSANEGAEYQDLRVRRIKHVEAGPIVVREPPSDCLGNTLLEGLQGRCNCSQLAELVE
jgi:hypothetical protein